MCPYCIVQHEPRALLRWRTPGAFACEVHRCYLLRSCGCCGELIRYFNPSYGHAFWMDCWPVCQTCGETLRPAAVSELDSGNVCGGSHEATSRFDWASDFRRRIFDRLIQHPEVVACVAKHLELSPQFNIPGLVAFRLLNVVGTRGINRGTRPIVDFALGAQPSLRDILATIDG